MFIEVTWSIHINIIYSVSNHTWLLFTFRNEGVKSSGDNNTIEWSLFYLTCIYYEKINSINKMIKLLWMSESFFTAFFYKLRGNISSMFSSISWSYCGRELNPEHLETGRTLLYGRSFEHALNITMYVVLRKHVFNI